MPPMTVGFADFKPVLFYAQGRIRKNVSRSDGARRGGQGKDLPCPILKLHKVRKGRRTGQ